MMKKTITIILLVSLLLPAGCSHTTEGSHGSSDDAAVSANESAETISENPISQAEPDAEPDTKKPKITFRSGTENVIIKQYTDYDLLKGVSARDNVDGNITDRIEIDKGGFDPAIAGEYVVTYSVRDSAGNAANEKKRTITVRQTEVLEAPPVWSGAIDGEAGKPETPKVFGGAWYYKRVSSRDIWCGIEATVTLPSFRIARYSGDFNPDLAVDPDATALDNPSVYFGGSAKTESDVGLSLSRALVDVKANKLSNTILIFRPFWRYITATGQDLGDYDIHNGEYAVSATGDTCIANYHWRYTEYYYLPGDTLRIVVYSPAPDKLQMQIEVIAKSELPESVEMRKKYGWKDPENFVSPVFTSPGNGVTDAEYKRVNAIDQVANEGKTVIETATTVTNAIWHDTYLYRVIDDILYRVPMTDERCATRAAPYDDRFSVSYDGVDKNNGGEVVTIHPGYTD